MDQFKKFALEYASRGWQVFPLKPGGKEPSTRHGYLDATTAEDKIHTWWTKYPEANIGIACGASDLVVVDIDIKNGIDGLESWQNLLNEIGHDFCETATVETPTGGKHLYFRSHGSEIKSSAGRLAPGIDIRAAGGYVVAPSSVLSGVGSYKWSQGYEPGKINILPFPKEIITRLNKREKKEAEAIPGKIPEGKRNSTLMSLAGSMRRRGSSEETILAALLAENQSSCNPPLPESEVRSITKNVAKYPAVELLTPMYESHQQLGGGSLPLVSMKDLTEPPPSSWTVANIIPEGHTTLIYGDGGQGKSYLVLALASCVASGIDFATLPVIKGPVIYVDYELSEEEQARRAYKVARGLGLEKPPGALYYLNPGIQENVPTSITKVAKKLIQYKPSLVVIDSVGAAMKGDMEVAKDIVPIFQALRPLGTVLLVDHQPKLGSGDSYKNKSAFGSVFKTNLARSVWQLQQGKRDGKPVLSLVLRHKKCNFGPLLEPIGLRANFGTAYTLEPYEVPAEPEEGPTATEQVAEMLGSVSEATVAEIENATGLPDGTIRYSLSVLKNNGTVKVLGKEGHANIYALVKRAKC